MQETTFPTVNLPTSVGGALPTPIAQGRKVPTRVLVRNISATMVFLAKASQDIVGPSGTAGDAFRLPPGASEVFVLKDKQTLFGAGLGVGGRVSVSRSDALPLV